MLFCKAQNANDIGVIFCSFYALWKLVDINHNTDIIVNMSAEADGEILSLSSAIGSILRKERHFPYYSKS